MSLRAALPPALVMAGLVQSVGGLEAFKAHRGLSVVSKIFEEIDRLTNFL